jgi:hypothetical protein
LLAQLSLVGAVVLLARLYCWLSCNLLARLSTFFLVP